MAQVEIEREKRLNLEKLYDSLLTKNNKQIDDHKESVNLQNEKRYELNVSFKLRVQEI